MTTRQILQQQESERLAEVASRMRVRTYQIDDQQTIVTISIGRPKNGPNFPALGVVAACLAFDVLLFWLAAHFIF